MGAALATLSAASTKLRLGSDYTFKVVVYAQPRVSVARVGRDASLTANSLVIKHGSIG